MFICEAHEEAEWKSEIYCARIPGKPMPQSGFKVYRSKCLIPGGRQDGEAAIGWRHMLSHLHWLVYRYIDSQHSYTQYASGTELYRGLLTQYSLSSPSYLWNPGIIAGNQTNKETKTKNKGEKGTISPLFSHSSCCYGRQSVIILFSEI